MSDYEQQVADLKTYLQEQGVPDRLVAPLLRNHTPRQIRNGFERSLRSSMSPEAAAEQVLSGRFGVKPWFNRFTTPPDWSRGRTEGEDLSPKPKQPAPTREAQARMLQELREREPSQEFLDQLPELP